MAQASSDQIGTLQAQAQALSARITQLGRVEDALSQQYDEATSELQAAQQKVAAATAQVAKADAATKRAQQALKRQAVLAYVRGGSESPSAASVSNATTTMLAQVYESSLATTQQDAVDQFHLASVQDEAAKHNLEAQRSAAQSKIKLLSHFKQVGLAAEAQLQAALSQDKGQIARLIAQQQAAQRMAQLAAAQARIAAQAQVLAASRQQAAVVHQQAVVAQQPVQVATAAVPVSKGSSAPSAAPVQPSPPPVGSGASGAVAAALSRVGDPYVFGAAGPSAFDCSGLVMWAYAQVGISLPHNSGAQYAVVTHIPMSALQPGDIVFVADPSQHEAMYIGGGQIVEAQHTGTNVLVTPLRSEFVLAGRVV